MKRRLLTQENFVRMNIELERLGLTDGVRLKRYTKVKKSDAKFSPTQGKSTITISF